MNKIGLGIDYSNICKDYNTAYLDRDNTDPATTKCMRQVLVWMKTFLSEVVEEFDYNIYLLNGTSTNIDDIAAKRFLFYSLEKEITLQTFLLQKTPQGFDNVVVWTQDDTDSVAISNDEDGEGVYLYFYENSAFHTWIVKKLEDFSIDDVPLPS
jgi:hypothetical protein